MLEASAARIVETPALSRRHEARALSYLADLARRTRRLAVAAIYNAGGHPGGSLSCADILACLYGAELYLPVREPAHEDRDRFVLSKGNAAPALYGVWAAMGFIPPSEAVSLASPLDHDFASAIKLALGLRQRNSPARVYALLGDGECREGEIWEGAMSAAHHRLSNLCAVVDHNKLHFGAADSGIVPLEPFAPKWRAFGWHVVECDGHDIPAILGALKQASRIAERPTAIIAHTIEGKGAGFLENGPLSHGSVTLTREQAIGALEDLGVQDDAMEDWLHGRLC